MSSTTLDRARARAGDLAAERRARAGQRLLACEGLFHLYVLDGREVVALQGVDFGVDWCEMVALLGPSGSGKSTMLSVMGGLERPSAGRVLLDGIDVTRLSEAELTMLRRRRLGFVWQGAARNLLPHASAWENLEVPMLLAGLPAGRRRRRARVLLDAGDLGDAARKPIRALSGGEQQRLAVAVALANNPPLLLADEPTSQLDRANVQRVVELLKEARGDLGTTVVLVTHDAEVAAEMDRTVTIRDGRVGAEGAGPSCSRSWRRASSCTPLPAAFSSVAPRPSSPLRCATVNASAAVRFVVVELLGRQHSGEHRHVGLELPAASPSRPTRRTHAGGCCGDSYSILARTRPRAAARDSAGGSIRRQRNSRPPTRDTRRRARRGCPSAGTARDRARSPRHPATTRSR